MTENGTKYYLTYDQVGSLRIVVDTSGNVVKRIDYDSFGNVVFDSNPEFRVPFGFAGGLYDPDTGLIRFGYRDYDPDTGRWTAKDPIFFAGGDANLYGYVLGDPVNLIDPFGLWGFAIDFGGAYGTGEGGKYSSAGSAGAGFYIGGRNIEIPNTRGDYVEIGGFIYQGKGKTAGAKIGAGINFTHYKTDASNFFKGKLSYRGVLFLFSTFTKYFDSEGNNVGWTISLFGKGIGFSKDEGCVQGWSTALQQKKTK